MEGNQAISRQAKEEAVLELDRRRISAASIGDAEAFASAFAADHVHVHATGKVESREEAARSVCEHPRLTDPRRPLIRFFGEDVAVLTGPQILRMGRKGDGEVHQLFVTQVAYRSEGEWRFVSMHFTGMGPP